MHDTSNAGQWVARTHGASQMRAYRKRPGRVHKVQIVVGAAEVDQTQGGQGIPDLAPREHSLRSCCISLDNQGSPLLGERRPRSAALASDSVHTPQNEGAIFGHLWLFLKDALCVRQRYTAHAATWRLHASV